MSRVFKNNWNSSTAYVVDDVVRYNFKYYLALGANTNSAPPNSNWSLITPIQVAAYILQQFLGLADGRVMIYNQDYKIPNDEGLYIVINNLTTDAYASTKKYIPDGDVLKERLNLLTVDYFTINLFSKDASARLTKDEALMSFNSTFSEQQQEIYNIKIATLSTSFRNISDAEGSGMLSRFAIDIAVGSMIIKENAVDYYDQFSNTIIYN